VLILGIDTATAAGSVALMDDERLVGLRLLDAGVQHSRRIFIEIDALLTAAAVLPGQLGAVAVTIGPGSFTGLRLGLSAAKGICLATGAALLPVGTLAALAARVPFCRYPVCALLDARKGEVYVGVYGTETGWPEELETPRALTPAALAAARTGVPTVYVGDGALVWRAPLAVLGEAAVWAPALLARPDAATVAALGRRRLATHGAADLAGIEPDYLRAPDARPGPPPLARP
jgi:tRNA threonylcarbamoyladenosine biosynthesis protein TsaB